MNKFNNIINSYKKTLSEAANTSIGKAVDDLETALKSSGTLKTNTNAKELAGKLFDISLSNDPMEDSIKSVFDKIRENPNNPNITDQERELILSIVSKKEPEKKETEGNNENENTTNTVKTPTNTQPSQQPNAKQYNPLNQ